MDTQGSFLNPADALAALELHSGIRVADLAAGSGFFTRTAARMVAPGEVWAVDADQGLLARIKSLAASEGLRNVEVLHGNIERAGGSHLPDAHFDAVLLVNALFSARHRDTVMSEAARVLKRGGVALVVDWSDSHGGLGPHPEHVFSQADAVALAHAAGLAAVGTAPAGAYHWGVILRKK